MRVGFVGVGAMGNPMASHVLDSGQFDDVYVYDLSKSAVGRMDGKCSRVLPAHPQLRQSSFTREKPSRSRCARAPAVDTIITPG